MLKPLLVQFLEVRHQDYFGSPRVMYRVGRTGSQPHDERDLLEYEDVLALNQWLADWLHIHRAHEVLDNGGRS